ARARRPPQEDPARHVAAAALDRLRILEEHHVLLDTVQDRVLPFHVGESGLDVVGHVRLDATLGHEPEDRDELHDPDRDDEDDLQDARQRVHQERRRPQDAFDHAHRSLFGAEDVRMGDIAPDHEQEEQDPEHPADPEPCPGVDPFARAVAPAPDPVPERVVPLPMLGDQVVDLPDELDREEHQNRRVHPDGVVERVVAGHRPDEPEVRTQDEDDPDGPEQQQELDAVPPGEGFPGGALALLRAARALHRRPVRDHVVVRHEFTIPSICDWYTSKQSDLHATKRTDTWFVAGDMITVWSIVTDFVTPSLVAVEGSRTLKVRCSPKPRWSEIGDWSITFRTAGVLALVLSKGNTPFLRSRIEVSAI